MSDELISRLQRLQRIAGVMRGLMHEARATAPARSQAKDTTGAVTVVLDAEGFPLKITVTADWRQRLGARTLSAAVMDACGKASLARIRAWTVALANGVWTRKVERMMTSGPDGCAMSDAMEAPELLRRQAEPRSLGDLSDAMVKAFDDDRRSPADASQFHGANRKRTVAISFDAAGMTGCRVDGVWAARQPSSTLSAAFGEALASARAAARAAGERTRPGRNHDTLLDEALSLLHDPDRLANS